MKGRCKGLWPAINPIHNLCDCFVCSLSLSLSKKCKRRKKKTKKQNPSLYLHPTLNMPSISVQTGPLFSLRYKKGMHFTTITQFPHVNLDTTTIRGESILSATSIDFCVLFVIRCKNFFTKSSIHCLLASNQISAFISATKIQHLRPRCKQPNNP